MVPIIDKGEFLGVFEIVSHFNSIEKKLSLSGYNSIVVADKKFEKQLTNSITKTFVDGYYVANFEPDIRVIEVVKEVGIENIIKNNKLYYEYKDNHILLTDTIFSYENEHIGHIIVLAPNGISSFDIDKIYLIHYLYGFIAFLVLSLIFVLLLDKKNFMQKLNDYNYNAKLILYMIIFFLTIALLLYQLLKYEENSKINEFLQLTSKENKKIYSQIYNKYNDLSTIIFKTKIDTQDVKNILLIEDKDKAREELYKHLKDTYKLYESHNLKQLHFHTTDNKSFLRFHRPDKYGDDLTGIRHTVEYVNKYKKPINGFEEGKIYNGFRFVYPIFDNDIYLGSVEVSFSVLSMLEELIKNFNFNADFFIKKDSVKTSLMEDELGNYAQSAMDDFFIEKSISDKLSIIHKNIALCQRNKEKIKSVNDTAKGKEAFSFVFCNKKEVVTFLPLINPILNESIGVIALSKENNYIKNKSENTLYTYFTLISVMALSLFLAYREMISRKNTELFNEQLNNAQKISKIGNWDLDLLTNNIYWSDEIYNIFEIDKELFDANYEAFLNAIHPDDLEMVNETYKKSLQTQEPYSIEHRLLMSDGRIKYVKENCKSEFNENGIPNKSSGTIQDITEQKLAELQTIEARKKAEDANKAKSEFLANMSHEIRTPMNAVIGLSEMLNQMNLKNEEKELVEKINSSSKILLGIINDILDYSKIEAGKLQLEEKAFSINNICSSLWVMFEQKIKEKEVKLIIEEDSNLPSLIVSDELRLTQVLTNLISNALKFTQTGEVKVSISLKRKLDSSTALISFCVKDSGIGITKEQLSKLFVPFSQADSSTTRKYGGTGLGLVITKNIIQALGGDIEINSKKNIGTEVYFELEFLVKSWEKNNEQVCNLNKKKINTNKLDGIEILLVEDNEINQLVAKLMLEKVGIHVTIANNGKEGVEKYLQNPNLYQLILMDLQMPIMSGYDATKEIRKTNLNIPIIALTAAAMIEDKQKALEAGMDEHLSKPINKEELYRVISHFTNKEIDFTTPIKNSEQLTIDLEALYDITNSKELAHKLLKKLKIELESGEFLDIVNNIQNKNPNSSFLIHSLKGVSGNVKANELFNITQTIDKKYKQEESITNEDINKLQKAIENYLIKIDSLKPEKPKNSLNKSLEDAQIKDLISKIKNKLEQSELITHEMLTLLIDNLKEIKEEELQQFKSLVEEFEFDKALEIIKIWEKEIKE
jgi:two-component system sensor histidine kinase/response regulator